MKGIGTSLPIGLPKIGKRNLIEKGVTEAKKSLAATKVKGTVREISGRGNNREPSEIQPDLDRTWDPSRAPEWNLPPMQPSTDAALSKT